MAFFVGINSYEDIYEDPCYIKTGVKLNLDAGFRYLFSFLDDEITQYQYCH